MSSSSKSWFRGLAAASAAVVFAVAGGAAAHADNVQDDVTAGGANSSVAVGGTTTVKFRVRANSGDGVPDCNFNSTGDAMSATLSITGSGAVSPASTVVSFSACEVDVPVVFTGVTAGPVAGTLTQLTNNTGGTFNFSPASFALTVTAPVRTATTTTVTCPAEAQTYTGSALEPCSALTTGAGGFSRVTSVGYTDNTNAGTANASASFAGDTTHLPSSGTGSFTIAQAPSTTTVTCPDSVVWTGAPQTPCSATVTGAGGLDQAATPEYSDNTAVGTATASAAFDGDANHTASSGSGTFAITRAGSSVTLTCGSGPFTYTGAAQTPCSARVTGAGGLDEAVLVTYEDNTGAGTATATAAFAGDESHAPASASATFTIDPAVATCVVTDHSGTYDGDTHGLAGTCTGVDGEDLTSGLSLGARFTQAGTHSADWTFDGGANHGDQSGTGTVTIAPAVPSCTVTAYDGPYTASAHGASGACVGVDGEKLPGLDLGATFTNVPGGTATWSIPAGTNYTAAEGTVQVVITPVHAVCEVDGHDGVYDAAPHGATGSCSGIRGEDAGELDLGDSFTDVPGGTATWTFTGNGNYADDSGTVAVSISKAPSTVTVICDPKVVTYDAEEQRPCSATASGIGIDPVALSVAYDDNVGAGTATANASWAGDGNHTGSSGSDTFEILKASSSVTLLCTDPVTYTGSALEACSATASGIGLTPVGLAVSYADNTDAGTARASAAWDGDDDHEGSSASTTFTIVKAESVTTVTCPDSVTFDGSAQEPCTAAVTGAGGLDTPLAVSYGGNVHAGTATASASYAGDANHEPSSDETTFTVERAPTTTTVSCPDGPYVFTGSPLTPDCTATTTGAGLATVHPGVTFTDNTAAGTATASASYAGDDDHLGSAGSATFAIDKAPTTVTVTCTGGPFVYSGTAYTPCSATVTGAGGLSESLTVTYANNTGPGTATATATYAGGVNHLGSAGSATFSIAAWTLKGFYSPVDMAGVWNTVKGGSTVPLKFEVFAGSTELVATSAVKSFTQAKVTCDGGTATDEIEVTSTGGTTLRYDSTGGQFIQNWQTPRSPGSCYRVTMTTQDGSTLVALFKLK